MNFRDSLMTLLKRHDELAQYSVPEVDDGLTSAEETIALCRELAAEGCVLVKNENVLPINKEETVAVFGRCQNDYFYVGYGSGGDVKPPYKISPMQAMEEAGVLYNKKLANIYKTWSENNVPDDGIWGTWPRYYDEMPLDKEMVADAASCSDKAVIIIGRSSGEDRESKREPGSWYLTSAEEKMLSLVTSEFDKVCVVLNCGSIFDVSWIEAYGVEAVLYAWQGGQESGRAVVDILTGAVNPSGKLTDTIAPIECYPSTENFGSKKESVYTEDIYVGYRYFETFDKDSVIYPFGHGLSYTSFLINSDFVSNDGPVVKIHSSVSNTGTVSGKEVVQVYVKKPEGRLGNPYRELVAFEKTSLLAAGEKAEIEFVIDLKEFSSYDDTGVTGNKNAYIIEAGEYEFFVGNNVREAVFVGKVTLDEVIVRKTLEVCPPEKSFERLILRNGTKMYMPVAKGARNLRERVLKRVALPMQKVKGEDYRLSDVKDGKITMDEFIATLSTEELECLSRGSLEAMNSPYGAPGNAAAFGGTFKSLTYKGVPAISTNDGPSGCRLQAHSSLFPIGAVLSSSFNPKLVAETMAELGREVVDRNSHVLLAPGMNIHRNPLCGRNFEYFSEDPYLTSEIGSAYVEGIQSVGCSAVPKHVCCNSQETARNTNDSIVSQRALREIYLRAFEKVIRDSKPDFLMTAYNKVNGTYTYYNFDLCTVLLRDEFGFEGVIMTDWWMKPGKLKEFPNVKDQALRVRAGNNLYMPGAWQFERKHNHEVDGSIEASLKANDGLSLGELQRNAKYVLNYCIRHI